MTGSNGFYRAKQEIALGKDHDAHETSRQAAHGRLQRFIAAAHEADAQGEKARLERLLRISARLHNRIVRKFGY